MDESNGVYDKRFAAAGIPATVDARRPYREWVITARGLDEWVSGVVLYDETIRQSRVDDVSFVKVLAEARTPPERWGPGSPDGRAARYADEAT
jgi:fructose-bisphosphate aldolase class I